MNQDKIWDYFQNEEIESFQGNIPRLSHVLKQFKANDKVLNIGVGNGYLEKLATKKGIDIHSLDPSEKSILRLKKYLQNKAKVGYSQEIPFENNYFDGVIMSEVIEHLNDDVINQSLVEINRVLKTTGLFIGTVPNNEDLKEQIVVCPKCGDIFHRWGHIQSFSQNRLKDLLEKSFIVKMIKPKMYIYWGGLNYKGKIGTFISYILYLLKIKTSNLNLFFIVSKK